jgi:hypothetical protein
MKDGALRCGTDTGPGIDERKQARLILLLHEYSITVDFRWKERIAGSLRAYENAA